jgi:hypothetical protein
MNAILETPIFSLLRTEVLVIKVEEKNISLFLSKLLFYKYGRYAALIAGA